MFDPSSLKIGFLAGTLGRGGAERQLIYMLRALKDEGLKLHVLCLTKGEALEREIHELGIKVGWVGHSQNNFVRLKNIIAYFRSAQVDVIQSSHFYTNIYAALAGQTLRVASLGAIRNDVTNEILSNGFFGRWQLNLPKRLVANSKLAVDHAITLGIVRSKITMIKNAVDLQLYGTCGESNSSTTILFAGRLVAQKRPHLFIELASKLREAHLSPRLNFIIAGDGPLRASLETLAMERGLGKDEMKFLGERSNMAEIYKMSDILVLTSQHEGTPNVILEAMACGLAVVATGVGGVPEVVREDCGLVVDPFDFSELVAATSTLITNGKRMAKMGENGREFVRKNHSIDSLKKELTAVYSQMLESNVSR